MTVHTSVRLWAMVGAALSLTVPTLAAAGPLRVDLVEKAPILDGVPGEWQRELGKLGNIVKGAPGATDLSAKAAISYDDKNIYVAADVTDDTLEGGGSGDRVDVVILIGDRPQTVSLFPGKPGKSAGKATLGGQPIAGAKVIEAPRKGGWTLEASVPWSALEGAATTRIGLRGGIFVFDSDGGAVDAGVGTASGVDADKLPTLLTTTEQALGDGLMKDKGLRTPSFQGIANLVGDGLRERVLVFDKYLVVLGPHYRGGKQYYFADMSVAGSTLAVTGMETRDFDGDGREDIVLRKRFTKTGQKTTRDVLQIMSFGTGDTPELMFQHEVGITTPKGSVTNDVRFSADASKVSITIRPGTAKSLDASNYDEPTEGSFDPVLLPWGAIDSQTYKHVKGRFAKTAEEKRAVASKPAPVTTPTPAVAAPVAPPPPDTGKVLAQFKKDRASSAASRFDQSGDVAGDGRAERVVLVDRDLAVMGPGFKSGTGYAFTTVPFASSADVKSVTLRDVTGDGKADLVVRGILQAKGPNKEDVEREIEVVFRVTDAGVKRVFGAELARGIGAKRITGSVTYEKQKTTATILLAPGRAVGFSKENYPFSEDSGPVGGLEPLILPWTGTKPIRYRWNGSSFDRL